MGSYDYDAAWRHWGAWQDHAPTAVHLRRLIRQRARALPFRSLLDVGTGQGHLPADLRREEPGLEVEGCDVSRVALARAAERNPDIPFHHLDVERGALERRYDLLVLSEVLEHLERPRAALANLRAMAAGHLILTTPTGPLLGTDRAFGHLRHFTPEALAGALAETGWRVVRLERWGWPFQILMRRSINLAPKSSYRAFGAAASYGPGKRLVSAAWRALFHLNRHGAGTQLIVTAAAIG